MNDPVVPEPMNLTEKPPGNPSSLSYRRRLVGPILLGMCLGFFVIQPLNVLVYNLAPQVRVEFHNISFWKRLLEMSTDSTSLFMGLAYAILGGITGLWFGMWLYQRDCLQAEQVESARRLAAFSHHRGSGDDNHGNGNSDGQDCPYINITARVVKYPASEDRA